jgi:thiol-disulfide isomerase/thioredoxin
MNKRTLLIGSAGAVAALAGLGGALWQQRHRAESQPDPTFWALRFERPEGGELALQSLRSQPVLLNFWATWCAPCVKEMPLLDAFHQTHRARGWSVVGLAVDSPTPVREFLSRRPMTFPIGLAGLDGVELGRSLGNENGGLPFSVLFGPGGTVLARKLGALHEPDLADWARRLG